MSYEKAVSLRRYAECTKDANLYLLAAKAFDALGMLGAAEACRRRASYYSGAPFVTGEYAEFLD